MSERRVAAVTETMRDTRVDVTSRESSSFVTFLGAANRSSTLFRRALAAASGALLACSFAPIDWWPFAVLCPAVLMWLWQGTTPREGAWLGFWFNAGTFAAGTYWLYISIRVFGEAPLWVAFLLMIGLVVIMGLYHAALGYFVTRWLPASGAVRWFLGVPAAWLLIEWWRGWFLSGFSWLSLGYSQTDTWLASFAPVAGVYGISAMLLLCAGGLTAVVCGTTRVRIAGVIVFLAPWIAGAALRSVDWTHPIGPPVSVAIIQGSISQEQKWLDSNQDTILKLYHDLTQKVLGTQLIVWPESAVPDLANNQLPYIEELYRETRSHHSALVFGILRESDEGEHYFNSVLALDSKISWYDKNHLVPFAEFFPVPDFVRQWMRLMSLPYSDFTRGGDNQPPLPAAGLNLGATVCYEDAYGSALLEVLRKADALVNVTNDAWFGHSTARYQHFQIARMRALEAGRYLIRAANNGVTGVIGPHGEVVARAPEFEPYILKSSVTPRSGLTPYARVGNWLVVMLATVALAYGLWMSVRGRGFYGRRPPVGTPSAAN
jgi:apolipoprotein N-acyltransferase